MMLLQYGISGEGFLPDDAPETKRRKRCSECSLGSISRTSTGSDWSQMHRIIDRLSCIMIVRLTQLLNRKTKLVSLNKNFILFCYVKLIFERAVSFTIAS